MSQQIVELVNQWATYEQGREQTSLQDFCLWYLANQSPELPEQNDIFDESPVNGLLGKLIGRISQYDHLFTKKALQEVGINNVDDMMYLHVIHYLKAPRKSEVINHMLSEFPSGIEIIRRLLKLSWIEELPDETDKRSKRIRLTSEGEALVKASYGLLHQAGVMMYDVLTQPEKLLLVHLLEKLDTFHADHYKLTRTEDFPTIYKQVTSRIQPS